jgi:membrane protein DedA with SNARE-associated domain
VLIGLSSKNRFLLLTAPQLGMLAFFVVGFLRLLITDPITYVLGRQYGEDALGWIERKTSAKPSDKSLLRRAERLFARAAPLVILVAPSALWCILAGAARMKVWLFLTCNVVGTVARLTLFWVAADALRAPLEAVLDGVEAAQTPLLALTVTLGVVQVVRTRRRRPTALTDADALVLDGGLQLAEEVVA